jgi:hypothetical protein
MTQPPGILLLDDGELDDVARLLKTLELDFTRLRGGQIGEDISPPCDLLIATPRRAPVVRRGSPEGARPGRPVRIIAVEEDSTAMRRMLRRMGFHLLVRLPCDESIWRLLVRRALYQGDERRVDKRIAVGSAVELSGDHPDAVLLDISNRGCRLRSSSAFELGSTLSVVVPEDTTGSAALTVKGELVRVNSERGPGGETLHTAAMAFTSGLDEATQCGLGEIINKWSLGPQSVVGADASRPPLPACESSAIPGLTLDDETDPSIRIEAPVALQVGEGSGDDAERRIQQRGAFQTPVRAETDSSSHVLMGRDLSAGGMRIERIPDLRVGDQMRLALHGPSRGEAFEVSATVIRDDGPEGFALGFSDLPGKRAEDLEKLVACLPDVESLEEGETHGLGAVISEILDDIKGLG